MFRPTLRNDPAKYSIKSFSVFDVNNHEYMAFAGESLSSNEQTPIVLITVVDPNKTIVFNKSLSMAPSKIKAIAIDELDSKIAFCYQTNP